MAGAVLPESPEAETVSPGGPEVFLRLGVEILRDVQLQAVPTRLMLNLPKPVLQTLCRSERAFVVQTGVAILNHQLLVKKEVKGACFRSG
mgnify:CR=1 FL=1